MRPRVREEDLAKIDELMKAGLSDTRIAELLGVSPPTLVDTRLRLGLHRRYAGPPFTTQHAPDDVFIQLMCSASELAALHAKAPPGPVANWLVATALTWTAPVAEAPGPPPPRRQVRIATTPENRRLFNERARAAGVPLRRWVVLVGLAA